VSQNNILPSIWLTPGKAIETFRYLPTNDLFEGVHGGGQPLFLFEIGDIMAGGWKTREELL
jgi:hypothetical protein